MDTSGMEVVHNSEMFVTLNEAQVGLQIQQLTLQARFQQQLSSLLSTSVSLQAFPLQAGCVSLSRGEGEGVKVV